eukprot:Skav200408  [mRNA]  locus=scaffold236:185624:190182:- [translate_table: standard]
MAAGRSAFSKARQWRTTALHSSDTACHASPEVLTASPCTASQNSSKPGYAITVRGRRPTSIKYKQRPAPQTSCFSDGISPAKTSGAEKLMVVDVTGTSPVRRAREEPKSVRCKVLRSTATSTLSDLTSL